MTESRGRQCGDSPLLCEELLPLSVDSLQYRIREKNLINGLNIEIGTPGITVIMGSNGAGKSIFLNRVFLIKI